MENYAQYSHQELADFLKKIEKQVRETADKLIMLGDMKIAKVNKTSIGSVIDIK